MGTRNITAVIKDGKFKVVKYCQWDGYPSGRGIDLLRILKDIDFDELSLKLNNLQYINDELYKELMVKIDIDPESEWITSAESARIKESYPQLHRDYGPEILTMILNATETPFYIDNASGACTKNSWCEWFYVVDLDSMKLYVHDRYILEEKEYSDVEKEFNMDHFFYNKTSALTFYDLNDLPSEETFLSELESCDE